MKKLSAKEVMRSVTRLAPRSGRNAIRSISTAEAVVTASVRTITRGHGNPLLNSHHIV
jgi:hypothetical protein